MQLAAKENIPLQLHVEGESDETYGELARNSEDKAGLARERIESDITRLKVDESYTHGLTPSVLQVVDQLRN